MNIHAISYYDEYDKELGAHELQDIDYTCSYFCMVDVLAKVDPAWGKPVIESREEGLVVYHSGDPMRYGGKPVTLAIEFGAYPCGTETDYDVYCANNECRQLLWRGLNPEWGDNVFTSEQTASIAATIKSAPATKAGRAEMALAFARMLQSDNQLFSPGLFFEQCGLDDVDREIYIRFVV